VKDLFVDLLAEYVLGQHPEELHLKIKAHLDSGCQSCRAELQSLEEAIHLLPFALADRSVQTSIKERVNAALDAESPREIEQESGRQSVSHYRLLRRLGIGAMGEVFLAEDTKLGRSIALKMIRPELATNIEGKKRFLREARAAAVLNHRGIATIYEIGEEEGTNFIAMEYVDGKQLSEVIDGKPLHPGRMIQIGLQLASALSEAHARGVLHRDLKPDNVHVRAGDEVKILDFGLAKFKERRLEDDYTTSGDRIVGTIPYMSPEQILGEDLDARTDLFSLGSILYEMATGKSPFSGRNPGETLENIVRKEPAPLENISSGLGKVIFRCLRKDRNERYSAAKELEADLIALQRGDDPDLMERPSRRISIAVLYFENLSEEKESDYFRAGMTEDILVELSKVKAWEVRPRSQVLKYKDREIDIRELGEDLKVTHLLQGSIRKAGNRLRISAQLIDTLNAVSVWAERYDRDLKDVFEIQSEIAHRIASALKVRLTGAEKEEIKRRPTGSLEAYDFYLRGREMIFRLSKEGIKAARDYFEQAIGNDPNYALAYAGLAQAYATQLSFYGGTDLLADLAVESANRALSLDENLAEAYAALGFAFFLKRMEKEAIDACRKAIRLNPHDAFATWISGRLAYRLNRYEEAARWFQHTIELLPDFYTACNDLAQTYENLGMLEEAAYAHRKTIETCRKYLERFPSEARAHIFLANSSVRGGEREAAIAEGKIAAQLSPNDPVMMYNLACLYSQLNQPEIAVEWLEKSIENGRRDFEWMKRDPELENIRTHPAYLELVSAETD